MEQAQTYLTLFLQDNEQLINYLAAYNNLTISVAEVYQKNKGKELANKLNFLELQSIVQTIGYFRSFATRVYIRYKSVQSYFNETREQQQDIETTYREITTNTIPSYIVCEKFVQTLNNILATGINAAAAMNQTEQSRDYTEASSAPEFDSD